MPDEMLALSFLQPWLWAIMAGHKPVENRTWKPPRSKMIGRVALHASAGWDSDGEEFVDQRLILDGIRGEAPPKTHCIRGAIIGMATIAGAFQVPGASRAEVVGPLVDEEVDRLSRSPWAFGPWCWVLRDVRQLREPVPCKGALGFWRVPRDIAARVSALEASDAA